MDLLYHQHFKSYRAQIDPEMSECTWSLLYFRVKILFFQSNTIRKESYFFKDINSTYTHLRVNLIRHDFHWCITVLIIHHFHLEFSLIQSLVSEFLLSQACLHVIQVDNNIGTSLDTFTVEEKLQLRFSPDSMVALIRMNPMSYLPIHFQIHTLPSTCPPSITLSPNKITHDFQVK